MTTLAYPLQWPPNKPRVKYRRQGKFNSKAGGLTQADALQRVEHETRLLGALYVVVTTNLEPDRRGERWLKQKDPDDPGVAVYFDLFGEAKVLTCDGYTRVAANLAAVAAHIAAVRAIDRYGVGTLAQMFSGFTAISAPEGQNWRKILGFNETEVVTADDVRQRRRVLAAEAHPDKQGGDTLLMARINAAVDAALRDLVY